MTSIDESNEKFEMGLLMRYVCLYWKDLRLYLHWMKLDALFIRSHVSISIFLYSISNRFCKTKNSIGTQNKQKKYELLQSTQ